MPPVFVWLSAVNGSRECDQNHSFCHIISNFPLLVLNNKLKHSLPLMPQYSNVCMCLWKHVCMCPNSTYAMSYGCVIIKLNQRSEVQRPFPRKGRFHSTLSPPFLHIPFLLSTDSLALLLKLERRHIGWTGRTNSSHALWLLDGILFSTQVLEGYSESAFLVINKASAGFHLDHLSTPR